MYRKCILIFIVTFRFQTVKMILKSYLLRFINQMIFLQSSVRWKDHLPLSLLMY